MKYRFFSMIIAIVVIMSSCKTYDELEHNPNVASENASLPPSLLLGRITYDLYQGGGVTNGRSGNVYEGPWDQVHRWNQYIVSNNSYYGGQNIYGWSTTATPYDMLKNVSKMEEQAYRTLGPKVNAYLALGKFFRAYIFIWLTQRVGDIPMSEAGQGLNNLTPKYDTQKTVYQQSLQLLEEANNDLATAMTSTNVPVRTIEGDIFFGNDLKKWQKAINTYKLRVLISLSKRADDTPELKIKETFANVLSDPTKYPIMTSNVDNMNFVFNASYNPYPHTPADGNNNYQNLSSTYLQLTTATQDPRTFVVATPAPAQLNAGKMVSDFSAYVGSNISLGLGKIQNDVTDGKYSYVNYNRYYSSQAGPEPYIILGYSELCFNIAEAMNRGWVSGASASDYYLKGIKASLNFYGLTEGQTLTVGDLTGKTLGTVTVSIANFLNSVAYQGDNAKGLEQILTQKYVSFFQNSGWEAFYNQRRTGYPSTFITSGAGINSTGKIPRRWQYPVDEQTYNAANYNAALKSQYNSVDDLYQDIWALK